MSTEMIIVGKATGPGFIKFDGVYHGRRINKVNVVPNDLEKGKVYMVRAKFLTIIDNTIHVEIINKKGV